MKTCFMCGHRDAPDSLFPQLSAEVERHIVEYGVQEFVVGHYGRFDSLAARAVRDAKKRHPTVTLTLLTPYHPAQQSLSPPQGCDGIFYPPGMETVPKRAAIVRANRYMVDHCGYLIACAWYIASNTWKLVEYVKERERKGFIHLTLLGTPCDDIRKRKSPDS